MTDERDPNAPVEDDAEDPDKDDEGNDADNDAEGGEPSEADKGKA